MAIFAGPRPRDGANIEVPRLWLIFAATGRALRRHTAFAPRAANVDFIAFTKVGLAMRTYERGVEDETLASGTSAAAAALVAASLGKAKSPVKGQGGALSVSFRRKSAGSYTDIWLSGPVEFVFRGSVDL